MKTLNTFILTIFVMIYFSGCCAHTTQIESQLEEGPDVLINVLIVEGDSGNPIVSFYMYTRHAREPDSYSYQVKLENYSNTLVESIEVLREGTGAEKDGPGGRGYQESRERLFDPKVNEELRLDENVEFEGRFSVEDPEGLVLEPAEIAIYFVGEEEIIVCTTLFPECPEE